MPDLWKPKSLEPGTFLAGRFSVVRCISRGDLGTVYQARDTRYGNRWVAVKERDKMSLAPRLRELLIDDFKRSASILAQLEHPSIPTIYDHFIEDGIYYYVTQWIEGSNLAQQMQARGGTVDEATVTKWAIQICDVLHYLHSQQPPIIHGDLNPAHLMLDDESGRIVLVGFSNAHPMRPTERGMTAIGALGYAPPEVFAGSPEPRSDLYALGATMFYLLTGSDPDGNHLLIFDFSKKPRPRQINPKISECMEKILMKMVVFDVVDRPKSALQLMRELQEHLDSLAQ